ncbi:MAG: hypothetical protein WBQ39_06530 [Terriglobales bacterium]
MATKQWNWTLFFSAAAMLSLLAGCGGSTFNVQNPPPPPPSQVAIAYQPEPGATLPVGSGENLTAVVTNDPNNYGVDWSVTCQNGAGTCGTLSAQHTASGAANSYTAPTSLSTNSTVVEIVAYATADHTKNAVAPITITTFNSSLQAGTYIFQAQGVDPSLNPYQVAGAIMLDGSGNIKGGKQTANSSSGSFSDTNLSGSYFLGNDGRGTITINTGDNNIGGNGVETFAFVYLSPSQALISQMDIPPAQTGVSATGTMDLQTSTAAPTGGYAFVVSGTDVVKELPVAFGGIFNIDSSNTISGNGSVTDEILAKKVNATALGLSGTLTNPDPFGAVTLNLTAPFGAGNKPIPLQFTGYIVDTTHMSLIETDDTPINPAPFGLTAGLATGQGTATGTFTSNASFTGTYVFGISGVDLSNFNILPSTLNSVGLFTANGSGSLNNGYTDTFLLFNTLEGSNSNPQTGAQISSAFTGTYSVDSTGTGRATSTSFTFSTEPNHGYSPTFFFYLTGSGNAPLVLQAGDSHYTSLGTGMAYPQANEAAAFSGDYGFSFVQQSQENGEYDGTAQLNANATTAPPSLSGFADVNISGGANQDQPFTGTFTAPIATGPFQGTLVGTNNNTLSSVAFTPQIAVDYYFIDAGHGLFVETDLVNSIPPTNPPTPSGQMTLGYYAARTPVCTGCP